MIPATDNPAGLADPSPIMPSLPGATAMRSAPQRMMLLPAAILLLGAFPRPRTSPAFNRKEDVIYGRKYGTALTMDVFTPKKNAKGIGVIFVVSGGFFSSHEAINPAFVRPFIDRGYTVFAVVHGSQPRFTVPEIIQDMNRAVRFIRHHAKDYGIDPDRIGVYGGSAGGHLSLMLGDGGRQGRPERQGPGGPRVEPGAGGGLLLPAHRLPQLRQAGQGDDPRHRSSAPVPGRLRLPRARQAEHALGPDHRRPATPGDHPADLADHARHADDPPTLIIHGDADKLVPLQQSEADRREAQEGRRRGEAGGQEGRRARLARPGQGPDPVRRLVRRHLTKTSKPEPATGSLILAVSEQFPGPARLELPHERRVVAAAHAALEVDFVGAGELVAVERHAEPGPCGNVHPCRPVIGSFGPSMMSASSTSQG